MSTDTSSPGLSLPARILFPPSTISEAAQAFLANGAFPSSEMPDPSDKAAWRHHIAAANAGLTQMTQAAAASFDVMTVALDLPGCTLYEIAPESPDPDRADAAIYYLHGGGFIVGGGVAAGYAATPLAASTRVRTYSADYRMPPDFPFPHALDDALEGYRTVLERHAPSRIVVAGSSAGAGLAASMLLKARDQGLPMPAGCVLHTPEADLTESGDTFETNDTIDTVLSHRLTKAIALYANGHDLRDPYLSPVEGDFGPGFPSTLLLSGTRDLFLSNTVRMHRKLRLAGISADLHVFEAMPHGGFFGAPEDEELMGEQILFIKRCIPPLEGVRER